ncbi:MAG: T9SS type A sorting domain-containing protein [Saprospiraceae bacterium]|nr:T9SS type A sorting domain-containing protein [Candidatus Vicinibacter affinis]
MNTNLYSLFSVFNFFLFVLFFPDDVFAQWTYKEPQSVHKVWIQDNLVLDENSVWMGGNEFVWDTSMNNWNFGQSAYFYSTSDGGQIWNSGRFDIAEARSPYISALGAWDAKTAWASIYGVGDGTNTIFTTSDGGGHWTESTLDIFKNESSYVNAISFKDSLNGFMFGDPTPVPGGVDYFFEIYTTVDGGKTWSRVPRENIPDPLPDEYGITDEYSRIGDKIWFVTDMGRLYSSEDGGLHWEVAQITDGVLSLFRFIDKDHGLTYTSVPQQSGKLLYTDNAGMDWKDVTPPFVNSSQFYFSITLIPQSYYILINISESTEGGPYKSYISKDLGKSWLQIGEGDAFTYARFVNPNVGYAGEGLTKDQMHPTRIFKYSGNPLSGLFQQTKLQADLSFTPNPVNDFLKLDISLSNNSPLLILINSTDGKLLWSKEVKSFSGKHSEWIDLKTFSAGNYILTVSNADGSIANTFHKN